MPETGDPAGLLDAGWRCEKAGALDKALEHYQLAAQETPDPAVLAEALRRQSSVYRLQGRWDEALDTARRSSELASARDLRELLADALNAEAAVHQARGPLADAVPIYERALVASESNRTRGVVQQNLGSVAAQMGDLEAAESRFHQSLKCFRQAGYREGEAVALCNLVAVALDRQEFDLAEQLATEAVAVAREVEDLNLLAVATKNQAEALAAQGEFEKAESKASEALGFFALSQSAWRQVECYRFLGDINVSQGDTESAQLCYARGLELAQWVGAVEEIAKLSDLLARVAPAGRPRAGA